MQAENTLMWKEILEEPAALRACAAKNGDTIEQIVSETRKRNLRHVTFCARGTSDNAATYGKYAFEILAGMQASSAAPSVLDLYGRNVDRNDSLVIGISQSGQTADVARIVKSAREGGALTVGITNTEGSLLAESAEYVLLCSAGPEKSVAATKTFLTEMDLTIRLAASFACDKDVLAQLAAVPDNLCREVGELKDAALEAAQRYRFVEKSFVLARGLNYPVALETALKIQETAYIGANGFAISNFYHGPKAMVQRDVALLVFAPVGVSFKDTAEFIDKMKKSGADLLVFSDDEKICGYVDAAMRIPSGNDFVTPFYNAAAAQMLACHLAAVKGNNPDKPRTTV